MKAGLAQFAMFLFVLWSGLQTACAEEWTILAPGLELRQFAVTAGPAAGSGERLAVLRIDPSRYAPALGSAVTDGQPRTMKEWADDKHFLAVINAGMFRSDDRLRSTGFMRDRDVLVNSYVHPSYGAMLAFQPRDRSLPPVRWVDRRLDSDWAQVLEQYDGIIQNYRLISRDRENLWAPSDRRHSAAAIGMDRQNHLVFVHCRQELSMHEFAQQLLDLPLDLVGAMYVEGGADAAMYVRVGDYSGRWVGEYQTSFFEASNMHFWPAPNVLGIRRK